MIKDYSEIAFGIDLVVSAYNTYNPIIIAEKLQTDLDINLTIYQIMDYFDTNKVNYEEELIDQQYYMYY